jgi:hypothetical protein
MHKQILLTLGVWAIVSARRANGKKFAKNWINWGVLTTVEMKAERMTMESPKRMAKKTKTVVEVY